MSRPKGSKNNSKEIPAGSKIPDDLRLPDKSLFRIDEVADYFSVSNRCIRLWLDHGHLEKEKIVGVVRIPRKSILECRFRKATIRPT